MNPQSTYGPAGVPSDAWAMIAAALILLAPAVGRAEDPPSRVVLFDGKTLDGWKKVGSYKAGEVKVEGGSIVLGKGEPMTAIVCTRPGLPTTNYELTFEARRTAGDDFFAAATFPVGSSFLTLVNGGWGGSVTGLSSVDGADASENGTSHFVKYQNGTWYRFRVRVTASALRCLLDDKEIIALRHDGQQLNTRIEVRDCQPLGFASWRCAGEVRAVVVRPLSAAEVEAVEKVD
jgi:hypothetical protein